MNNQITLSPEQVIAAERFAEFLEKFDDGETSKGFFVIAGYAGTGKSYAVKTIIEGSGLTARYMAYTGKAALVLQKYSGVDAATIHSSIYKLRKVPDTVFEKLYIQLENCNNAEQKKEIEKEIEDLKRPTFVLNEQAFENDKVDLLVLDECSMVDDEVLRDLLSFGIPIIALGDPGQLPPIGGEGALFKGQPDAMLTEIRRQALDSPIIQWSMWARTQRTLPMTPIDTWETDAVSKLPASMVVNKPQWMTKLAESHDITICWKNKTRMWLNSHRRRSLGFHDVSNVFPTVGDTIVFKKNDKAKGIFNGLFAEVVELGELLDNYLEVTVMTELGDEIKVKIHRYRFEEYTDPDAKKRYKPWDFRDTQEADFGYALTCHTAQGSQWDNVLVYEENVFNWFKGDAQEQRARWLYTAITRAAKKLTIIAGKVD